MRTLSVQKGIKHEQSTKRGNCGGYRVTIGAAYKDIEHLNERKNQTASSKSNK